jgi:transcriptional regulator with XRE-family HTH domain
MTQVALAEKAGVSLSTVQRVEAGSETSCTKFRVLAEALGLHVSIRCASLLIRPCF